MSALCPHCQFSNRPGAHFCARCGAPLALPAGTPGAQAGAPAATAKLCPRCQTPAPVASKTCSRCGYTFATAVSPRRYWVTRLAILGGGIVAILLIGLTLRGLVGQSAGVAPAATLAPDAALQRAILATVQVLAPEDGSSDTISSGSGTVINGEKGYILTNFHVIGDPVTGTYANDQKMAWIALSPNGSMQPPVVRYRAEVAAADHQIDLALLHIVALSDGRQLPANLGLTAIPVGDSASVTIGDAVTVLGYPGLGGDTITLTRGTVSGFIDGWIKTDAETNPGNSGGAAIDAAGNLIGVPSAGYYENDQTSDRLPGKLGLIRPINAAQAVLNEAR